MEAKPTASGVIIKLTGEETTEGGLIVNMAQPTGTIVAIGPGAYNLTDGSRLDMQTKVGDYVQVEQNRMIPLIGHEGYAITAEEYVVAILPQPKAAGSGKT